MSKYYSLSKINTQDSKDEVDEDLELQSDNEDAPLSLIDNQYTNNLL